MERCKQLPPAPASWVALGRVVVFTRTKCKTIMQSERSPRGASVRVGIKLLTEITFDRHKDHIFTYTLATT